MPAELVLSQARLILPDQVLAGTLHVIDGRIAAIDPGHSALPAAEQLGHDYLMPGIVDLHTDNLERQVQPRINARWPSRSAYLAHDAQCAAAGITTVLDAFCVGDLGYEAGRVRTFRDGVADGTALAARELLRAEHLLHLRCELPAADMQPLFAAAADHPAVRMVSLMDHTPGFGQYATVDRFRDLRGAEGLAPPDIDHLIDRQQSLRAQWRTRNRAYILAAMAGRDVVLASHDDRTAAEVADNHADGIDVSEFPVSFEAAQAARALNMRVIAGAPNLVRGGSHTGNVAVAALLAAGLVDALASDYVPTSLIEAAFHPHDPALSLPQSVALVTDHPARIARLHDRGRLHPGLRADLIHVHLPPDLPGMPVIRRVWRAGVRVL